MIQDLEPIIEAARNKLQVVLDYTKTNGEVVQHKVGIYEIGANPKGNEVIWGWDVDRNDSIRQFLIANINSFEVLADPFFPPQPWPIKINGEIVG